MNRLSRSPETAAEQEYDLVVVGGGIQGACIALEASFRGLRVLLLERDDFGSHTSYATLRIIHGGLRYLRQMDLPRFFESARERSWYLRHFPDLVRPQRCVLPLDGKGWRRASLLRAALGLNDALSGRYNRALDSSRRIPRSQMLDSSTTADLVGKAVRGSVRGGAMWHDAIMLSSERILIEILRWAASCGATILNYVEATGLQVQGGRVSGVIASDRCSEGRFVFRSPSVVNCAGPWAESVASSFLGAHPALFNKSLAFNLLLDCPEPPAAAVAVPSRTGAHGMYFLVPWKGRLLAGTVHLPISGNPEAPTVPDHAVRHFLQELVDATSYTAGELGVCRVYAGFLPVRRTGSVATRRRALIVDHSRRLGPEGFYSVVAIKWTTARRTAERFLRAAFPERPRLPPSTRSDRRPTTGEPDMSDMLVNAGSASRQHGEAFARRVTSILTDESVVHADDAVYRRMNGVYDHEDVLRIGRMVCQLMNLEAKEQDLELKRVLESFGAAQ